jgi:hypothetical protein
VRTCEYVFWASTNVVRGPGPRCNKEGPVDVMMLGQ